MKRERKLLSTRMVAFRYGFEPRTISRWCREGKVTGAVKIGRVWRIPAGWRP
jgi:hypothetical protein